MLSSFSKVSTKLDPDHEADARNKRDSAIWSRFVTFRIWQKLLSAGYAKSLTV